MDTKTRYPYIVKMNDEVLPESEIEKYKAEARATSKEKLAIDFQLRLVNFLGSFSFVMIILTAIGTALAYLSRMENWVEYFFYIIAEIIVLFIVAYVIGRMKEKKEALAWVDESELDLIDTDPTACATLEVWVSEHEIVKAYVEKIAALGRLPTFAEFHCVEYWVQQKEKNKPVESLKTKMNIKAATV